VDASRRGRGRPPQVPPTPREPIGKDRAGASTPPRQAARRTEAPRRPDIPADADVDLPGRVRKEIDRLISDRSRAKDVKACLALGTAASEDEDHATASLYLLWAKHLAPRSAVVREALGIALYRADDFRAALAELQAYRRLSGTTDQNHLIADCIRSEGRDVERAVVIGMELVEDERAEIERRAEAAIVVAAVHLADGRTTRARTVLDLFLSGPVARSVPAPSAVRLLWVAADVAEAEGATPKAIAALERLISLDAAYPDAAERLERLRGSTGR
jgi:tetratricopeptide (TPR) repeat protein